MFLIHPYDSGGLTQLTGSCCFVRTGPAEAVAGEAIASPLSQCWLCLLCP